MGMKGVCPNALLNGGRRMKSVLLRWFVVPGQFSLVRIVQAMFESLGLSKGQAGLEQDGKACKKAKEGKAKTISMLEAKSSRSSRRLAGITARSRCTCSRARKASSICRIGRTRAGGRICRRGCHGTCGDGRQVHSGRVLGTTRMARPACSHASIIVCPAVLGTLVVEGGALEVGDGLGIFGGIGGKAVAADAAETEGCL